jgi:hypothetical protein
MTALSEAGEREKAFSKERKWMQRSYKLFA